ncbi:prepilin peptidase [Pediococcus acidilactici]
MLLLYHLLIFYFGSAWGSFLMATYQRRVSGESITFPASHCDYCWTPLPYFCLFPIFSYCVSRGRCLFCGNQIPLKMLGLEVISGISFWLTVQLTTGEPFTLLTLLILSFLSVEDYATRQIHSQILLFPALFETYQFFSGVKFAALVVLTVLLLNNFENQRFFQKMGQGDLEVMVFLALLFGTSITSGIICLACLIALVRIMVTKQRMVAFVPCLFAANWLVLTYINHSAPQLIMLR